MSSQTTSDGTMPSPHVEVSRKGSVIKVRFTSSTIGQREVPGISSTIIAEIDKLGQRLSRLVLDMTEVEFLSSLGLGMIIDARNRAHSQEAVTELINASTQLMELFQLVKVKSLFTFPGSPHSQ